MNALKYGFLLILFASLFFLPDPDTDYLFLQSVNGMAREWIEAAEPLPPERSGDHSAANDRIRVVRIERLEVTGGAEQATLALVEREIRQALVLLRGSEIVVVEQGGLAWTEVDGLVVQVEAPPPEAPGTVSLTCVATKSSESGHLVCSVRGVAEPLRFSSDFFKWYAILPPFVAIVLALLLQRTIMALFCGVWLGATLLSGLDPLRGLWLFLHKYLYEEAIRDQFRLEIIGFVIFLCAMVGVLSRGGGVRGFVNLLLRFARTVRSTQLATYIMGIAIFFDDYSNCILVGSIMRPLADRMKISREKLAYIVDSTAAPIAGLSMLSTWIAYEVSTFSAQLPEAGVRQSGYEIFLMTIPYRFYCIFTLIFIFVLIMLRRDFGPMLTAERRARSTGEVVRAGGRAMVTSDMTRIETKPGVPERWFNAVLPILAVIFFTLEEFWRIGGGWSRPLSDLLSITAIREVLSEASEVSAARPIFNGAMAGFVLATVLLLFQRILTPLECIKAAAASTKALFFAVIILFLAWCIGGVCSDIGTAHYLIALFKGVIPPLIFPIILFLTACLVSFSTGSSWSTMSILLPNTVLFAVKMGELSAIGPLPMLVISIGAVLEGSIFGDHCSPISDTTILSSVSAASDHLDHVKTQIPYALFTMSGAILIGYLPAATGIPAIYSIVVGILYIIVGILLLGRRAHRPGPGPKACAS